MIKKSKATNFSGSKHADHGLQISIGLATMGIGISLEGIYFLDEQSSIRLSLAGSSKTNREEKNYASNAFDDGRFGNTTRKITHEIETSSSIFALSMQEILSLVQNGILELGLVQKI